MPGPAHEAHDADDAHDVDEAGAAQEYRPLLFSIAYGMTGSVGDAEDIVQDAFLGLTRARQAGTTIADPKAYLTTAVTRLGINHLSSARVRRETYVGDWLPEPVVVPADGPGEHAELQRFSDPVALRSRRPTTALPRPSASLVSCSAMPSGEWPRSSGAASCSHATWSCREAAVWTGIRSGPCRCCARLPRTGRRR